MTNREKLDIFISMIPFLSEVMGKNSEIVVHDLTDPKHSIVAIANPISGRKIGDSMTDLPQEALESADFIANYSGKSSTTTFRSSTYFIRNDGELIGMLCINREVDCVINAQRLMKDMFDYYNISAPENSEISESLDTSIDELMRQKISSAIAASMIPVSRMTNSEKRMVVQRLKDEGVFSMKGAVAELSSQLEVSVPTIYRYIKKTE